MQVPNRGFVLTASNAQHPLSVDWQASSSAVGQPARPARLGASTTQAGCLPSWHSVEGAGQRREDAWPAQAGFITMLSSGAEAQNSACCNVVPNDSACHAHTDATPLVFAAQNGVIISSQQQASQPKPGCPQRESNKHPDTHALRGKLLSRQRQRGPEPIAFGTPLSPAAAAAENETGSSGGRAGGPRFG